MIKPFTDSLSCFNHGTIHPIRVVEDWSLCHHLACVVHYLARAGCKGSSIEALRQAEWYLKRELTCYQKNFSRCLLSLVPPYPLSVDSVVWDWKLSPTLEKTLIHLKASRAPATRKDELLQALKYLQQELCNSEQEALKAHNSNLLRAPHAH